MAAPLRSLGSKVTGTAVSLKNCSGEFFVSASSPSHLSKSVEQLVTSKVPSASFPVQNTGDSVIRQLVSKLIGNNVSLESINMGLNNLKVTHRRMSKIEATKFYTAPRPGPFKVQKRYMSTGTTKEQLAEAAAKRIAEEELMLENERRKWLKTVFINTTFGSRTLKVMAPFMKFSKIMEISSTHPEMKHLFKGVNLILSGCKFIGCGVIVYLGSWGKEVVDDFRGRMKRDDDDRARAVPEKAAEVQLLNLQLAERDRRIKELEDENAFLKMRVAIAVWKHCSLADWSGGHALGPEDLHVWGFMNPTAKE